MVRVREAKIKGRQVKVIEVSPIGTIDPPKNALQNVLKSAFYATKLFGIIPFDLIAFYRRKEFKCSIFSSLVSLCTVIVCGVQFHRYSFSATNNVKETYPSLTFSIYVVIVYSEPLTMIIIVLTNICNQRNIISVMRRFQDVEKSLIAEGGQINYTSLSRKLMILVFILIGGEMVMMIYYETTSTYQAEDGVTSLKKIFTWLWLFVPITITSLARVWFIALMNVSELYLGITNEILDTTGVNLEAQAEFPGRKWTKEPIFDDSLGQKLMRLCHLHAELGKISHSINHIFHLENLLAMLFTLLLSVTQMYFIYLAALNQQVPPLFRAADNMILSIYYVLFGLWKVFYVIWSASQVKQQAQLTGSYLHQIAIAVDEVPCYRFINQLSVQIWQQRLEFPVIGFFLLDMSTIGTFSGAILVYVVILIQFNLAGGS